MALAITPGGINWNVYVEAEDRQKRLEFNGAAGETCTVNELYSALMNLFDEPNQSDDGTPMSAQTPTEYTLGIIDAGDDDPWFIDQASVETLTGGAIKTASWTRDLPGDGTGNTGIVMVQCQAGGFTLDSGDIGDTCTHSTGSDTGTILDINTSTYQVWIRPTDNALANDWDTASGNVDPDSSANIGTVTAAGVTGESLWANTYTLGTLAANTHAYVYQGTHSGSSDTAPDAIVTAYKGTVDWWSEDHIDVLIKVCENGDLTDRTTFIDDGYITFLFRQYTQTYDFYIVDLFAGGRNPIPVATGPDSNNTTEIWTATTGAHGVSEFVVGEEIVGPQAAERGIVTAYVDNVSVSWYLIGSPKDNIEDAEEWTGQTTGTTATLSQAPQAAGPSAITGSPTVTHAADFTYDIDQDTTNERYSIEIDCQSNLLADIYEWLKYLTRKEAGVGGYTDGLEGEQYIGNDQHMNISNEAGGSFSEGDPVWGQTSGAQGTIVARHANDDLVLRNTRGTFVDTEAIGDAATGPTITADIDTVRTITPIKPNPFGTFAGGRFFGAPGVVLVDMHGDDANNFELVDDDGNTAIAAPDSVSIEITNTRLGDMVSCYRLTGDGGTINKAEYTNTSQAAGATTLIMSGSITQDTPASGTVKVVDADLLEEHRYRYLSFATTTFTLFNVAQATCDGAGANPSYELDDVSVNFTSLGVKVGDIVRNDTNSEWGYVLGVATTKLTTTIMANDWDGVLYTIGASVAAYDSGDDTYVPFIDIYETTGTAGAPGSESTSIVFLGTRYARFRCRQAGDITPFEQDASIVTGSGRSIAVVRNADTIYT